MPRATASENTVSSWIVNQLGWIFLALLALSPALFGANVPLAWGLNAAGFGLFAMIFAGTYALCGRALPVPVSRLAIAVLPVALLLCWIMLQASSWLPASWQHPAWAAAAGLLGVEFDGAVSVNPHETRLGALRLATAATVFVLAAQIGREPHWARRLVTAVAVIPTLWVLAAVVAKTNQSSLHPFQPLSRIVAFEGQLTGPFVNQNHFAIYLGLGLVAAWALFIDGVGLRSVDQGLSRARAVAARIADVGGRLLLYSVLLLPLFGGVLMTGSRAGLLLTGFAMLLVSILVLMQPGSTAYRRGVVLSTVALAAASALVVLEVHGERVTAELSASNGASDFGSRLAVADMSMRAIAERPILGHGYATFADVFPLYRDGRIEITGRWEEAHNAYIEGMLGLGVPAALLLALPIAWIALQCMLAGIRRRRNRFAPLAAFGGAVLLGLHALIDFSIQIQGVTLLFATLLGVGYSQSWSSREELRSISPRPTRRKRPDGRFSGSPVASAVAHGNLR